MLKNLLLWTIAVVSCASLPAQGRAVVAAQAARADPDEIIFMRPTRRAPGAPPAALADLPHAADRLPPLTLEVVTRHQSGKRVTHTTRHTVARTADRIHMTFADGREWLFERNPLDPRRVSGQLIVHARRTIVLHEASDLRNMLGVNGWADVLMLGVDSGAVSGLKPTGRTRMIGSVRFVRLTSQGQEARISDIWWSREHALPGGFVVRDRAGLTRVSVDRLRTGVNAELLRAPSSRFPEYEVVDLAEWLEGRRQASRG